MWKEKDSSTPGRPWYAYLQLRWRWWCWWGLWTPCYAGWCVAAGRKREQVQQVQLDDSWAYALHLPTGTLPQPSLFLSQPRITGWQPGIHASPTNQNSAATCLISLTAWNYWLTAGHTCFTYQQELCHHLTSLTAWNYWLIAGHTCLTYQQELCHHLSSFLAAQN